MIEIIILLLCFPPEDSALKQSQLDFMYYANFIQVNQEEECYWVTVERTDK